MNYAYNKAGIINTVDDAPLVAKSSDYNFNTDRVENNLSLQCKSHSSLLPSFLCFPSISLAIKILSLSSKFTDCKRLQDSTFQVIPSVRRVPQGDSLPGIVPKSYHRSSDTDNVDSNYEILGNSRQFLRE